MVGLSVCQLSSTKDMIPDRGFKAEPLYPATLQGIADFSIEWVATRDSGSLHKMNTVYDYLGVGCHEWLTDLEVEFRYMKIHIFALRWRDEIRRSSQLGTLLKLVVVNRT